MSFHLIAFSLVLFLYVLYANARIASKYLDEDEYEEDDFLLLLARASFEDLHRLQKNTYLLIFSAFVFCFALTQ